MTKQQLREKVLAERRALSVEQREEQSHHLMQHLIYDFDWAQYQVIHIFLTSKNMIEVDTQPIIQYLWKHHPHISIVTNRLLTGKQDMSAHLIRPDDDLVINAWGIPEPLATAPVVPPKEVDIFIIPMLASDYEGNRLGYGGGFYDRLLARANPEALRVGINFFEPLTELIPIQSYDEALDYLVTPDRKFNFKCINPGR